MFSSFKGKKGMAEGVNTMRILILFVVIAIPLVVFAVTFTTAGKAAGNNEACRLSIVAATQTKLAAQLATGGALDINCPYETVKIKKNDVSKGGKVDWALLNGKIAREMYNCYVKTAGGKYNPYSKKDTGDGDSFCLVCSRLDFSEINNSELVGFQLYMAAKRIPGEKMSFYEAVTGKTVDAETLSNLRLFAETKADTYKLNQPYVIVWRMSTFDAWSAIGKVTGGVAATGAAIGLIAGPVGAAVGGAIGAVGGFIGGFVGWMTSDDKLTSEHLILPEAALSATIGDVLGRNAPLSVKSDTRICTRLIDMRED